MDCTSASKCVCCAAGSARKCWISMCSCADNGLLALTTTSSPNLSQVADTPNTAASSRKRACVGMASPMSHLRAACTLIASSGFCALNARCSSVARVPPMLLPHVRRTAFAQVLLDLLLAVSPPTTVIIFMVAVIFPLAPYSHRQLAAVAALDSACPPA